MRPLRRSIAALVTVALAGTAFAAPPAEHERGSDTDYGRAHIGGSQGLIHWESMLHGDALEGWETSDSLWTPTVWSREGDSIIADAPGPGQQARLAQGDATWAHYEFKVQGTLVEGSNLQIHFGISEDGLDYYLLDFLSGWQALSISRMKEGKFAKLDVVNFVSRKGQEYDIVIDVRGHSITSYIDGTLVNRLTVATETRGGVGLATWGKKTIARFRDPKIRHYYRY